MGQMSLEFHCAFIQRTKQPTLLCINKHKPIHFLQSIRLVRKKSGVKGPKFDPTVCILCLSEIDLHVSCTYWLLNLFFFKQKKVPWIYPHLSLLACWFFLLNCFSCFEENCFIMIKKKKLKKIPLNGSAESPQPYLLCKPVKTQSITTFFYYLKSWQTAICDTNKRGEIYFPSLSSDYRSIHRGNRCSRSRKGTALRLNDPRSFIFFSCPRALTAKL